MPLPIDFIERLKAANPIAEVMSSYVTLKRTGRDYVCLCPFHNEKTPSCHIHPDKEYFHCFGCGAGGDVITFTMKYNNLDYWEAVKLLAERGGVPLPEDNGYDSKRTDTRKRFYEMNKTAARFFYHQLKTQQGKECLDYLINKRKLSIETIKKYGMGFAPNSWSALKSYMLSEGFTEEELEQGSLISRSQKNTRNTFDFFVNRAMFPFIDLAGHIVGFGGRALTPDDKRKYLNSKDTLVYSKNRFLFSMNFAKNAAVKDKTILLCEGNLDVISLNQAGFENAVASCGTALTPEQAKIISNYADNVVICYDADGAGQKATTRAIKILGETGLKTTVIKMNGAKDPDEYINKFGADHFRHLLKKSDGAIEFELDKCKDGIDMDTDIGRIDYLKKAYKVLADISSPTEREIYAKKVAAEQNVSITTVNAELNAILKNRRYQYSKKEWTRTITFADKRDTINPEANEHRRESAAEAGIIYYLYNNHDACGDVLKRLPPDKFVTSFNRRVYESLTSKITDLQDCSVSSFNGEFSPEEVGKITEILEKYQKKFDYILVDEYQDTNYSQYLIIKKLAEQHKNICVVGDDAQSIYSFRGARIENILNFRNDYPGYKLCKLEQNYRSTTTIVDAANSIISRNKEQIPKKTFSQNEEGDKIRVMKALSDKEEGFQVAQEIFRISQNEQAEFNNFAILYRTNAQSRIMEEALRKRNIPYKIYGGLSFYQRKEIKDLIAYLRLTINQNDEEALKRIINYPRRGIGDTTIDKLKEVTQKYNASIWTLLCNLNKVPGMVSAMTAAKLTHFRQLIEGFTEIAKEENAYETTYRVAKASGIIEDLSSDDTPEGVSRRENIQELLNAVKDFCETAYKEGRDDKLPAFLEGVALLTDQDSEKPEDNNKVTLMTIHSAKG
ncbi:MAG: DNA primase, partial [Ruminococcus bicirculans]|nr:DNA primase [Ruminococcus bicirculans (ex Wegman et al. 2014)]